MTTPDAYLRRLEKGLKPLPRAERKRIVDEMRSHMAERGDAAIEALGPADVLAASFVDDYDAARSRAPGARIFAQASKAAHDIFLLAILWPLAGLLGLIGFVAANTAISELVRPDALRVSHLAGGCCLFEVTDKPEPLPHGWVETSPLQAELVSGAVAIVTLSLSLLILVLTIRHFILRPLAARRRTARLAQMHLA